MYTVGMKIILASDHAGFELKEQTKEWLLENEHEVNDSGALSHDPEDNYPLYMHKAAGLLVADQSARAIVFGGSGNGEAMVLNRYKGVRAIVYNGQDSELIRLGRAHNNANALAVGARFVDSDKLREVIEIFLATEFDGERHTQRVLDIDNVSYNEVA